MLKDPTHLINETPYKAILEKKLFGMKQRFLISYKDTPSRVRYITAYANNNIEDELNDAWRTGIIAGIREANEGVDNTKNKKDVYTLYYNDTWNYSPHVKVSGYMLRLYPNKISEQNMRNIVSAFNDAYKLGRTIGYDAQVEYLNTQALAKATSSNLEM